MVTVINYDLEFEPNFKNFTFSGKEIINIKIPSKTIKIKLDAAELKIKKCYVISKDKTIKASTKLDDKKEELSIKFVKQISGLAKLYIEFTGILNDRLLGFYKSQYKDSKGKTKYLATTQFEAADARRAFPCWDHPEAKATFDIKILTDGKLTAISNMPQVSKKKIGKKFLYKFSRTPVMSTYLVYLGVGEFEFLNGKLGKLLIRIVTTKGNKSKGKLALDFTKKFLKDYEKYFGIKYPLPKLDLIAIPDFAAGAMENWGAITFRESILLYDPKTSSTNTKQLIAEVISHELAHQWFGNLVTMKWWDDLWLNESFATFMATKIVVDYYPEWDLWDQFLETAMNAAMRLDSLKTSHPIHANVKKPSEIQEIFDSISYDKGGCVLRMLESYVGENNFRKGLKHYLKGNMYSNATGADLWESIEHVSKKPVRSMINTWIRQVGFPLVVVTKKNSHLGLEQSRFLLEPGTKKPKGLWSIPISVGVGEKISSSLLTTKTSKIKLNQEKIIPIVNSSRKAFFRVKYDKELLTRIKPLVAKRKLDYVDRWSIQNDLFALCVAGRERIRSYLDFSDAYHGEDSYLPKVNVANNLNFLYFLCIHEKFSSEIKKYTQSYFSELFEKLGWDPKKDEKHTDTLLRGMVIAVLGKLGDQKILHEAKRRFNVFLKKHETLRPDLREVIFSLMAWTGDEKIHNQLVQIFKKAGSQEAKLRVLGGLCNFRNEKLLLKTLDFALSKEVRSQNIALPIVKISGNPFGKKILWPWLKKNWKPLTKKFGFGNPLANRIVSTISLVADSSMEKEIILFFKNNPTPGTEMTLKQTLERIRIHSRFLQQIRNEFIN
jgi:tricorn protease interacting factor F2/3